MAGPAELVNLLSEVTGVPLATVVEVDRNLRKAGLRTKSGRGPSAARVTNLDAANLLTAIIGSPQAYISVAAVTRYAATCVDQARSSNALFGAIDLPDLAELNGSHSFVDGVSALIKSATSGELATLMANSKSGWTPQIELFAFMRATYGRIRIAGLPNGRTASVEYVVPRTREKTKSKRAATVTPNHEFGDLEQSCRVTERTILAVASLLAEES